MGCSSNWPDARVVDQDAGPPVIGVPVKTQNSLTVLVAQGD